MASIGEVLSHILAIDPAAPAIEIGAGDWWTWGDLAEVATSVRAAFTGAGLVAGSRVGICFRNRPQEVAALVASVVHGTCAVALNPLLPPEKLVADAAALGLAMIVAEEEDLSVLEDLARTSGIAAVTLPSARGTASAILPAPSGEKKTRPGVLVEMLTSGTTGTPKRIPLLTSSFEVSIESAVSAYEKRAGDDAPRLRTGIRILSAPLTHISGLSASLMTLAAGRKLCLLEKFRVDDFVAALERHRPKVANAPPAALRMILDAHVPREKLGSLVALRTGTAPLDPAIVDEFLARYDIPVLQSYGATEFAGAVAGWSLGDFHAQFANKRGSVGRFMAGIEGRIVDPDRLGEVPPGTEGILQLRGAQLGSAGEWLSTTDRAVIDADGYLFVKGRFDGAIIRGGFKVHPEDVVKAVEAHPGVREAVVVGIVDRRLGEVPVCAVIPVAGATPTAAELTTFLRDRLLPYQIPTSFLFVDELPRTPSMKPKLEAVRALFQAQVAAE